MNSHQNINSNEEKLNEENKELENTHNGDTSLIQFFNKKPVN